MRRFLSIMTAACIAVIGGATSGDASCCGGGGNANSGYGGGVFIGEGSLGDGSPSQVAMKVWGYYTRYYKAQFDDLHAQEELISLEGGSKGLDDLPKLKARERDLENKMIRKLKDGRVRLTREAAEVMIDDRRSRQ